MNCILYLRVSSAEQVKNFSLDTQEELCRSYAQRMGYQVLQVFKEEGESAKTADRPELVKLLDYCAKNKTDVASVIVYKFDRMARNTSDHLAIRAKLAEHGIKLESTSEQTDDSPAGKFMETLFSAVAQLDNEVRAERTRNGLYRRFKEGLATRAPLGYKMQVINGKKLAIMDDNFPLVKRSWELMSTGTKSLSEMAKEMNALGLTNTYGKTIKPITKQYVSRMFNNKFYFGLLTSEKHNEEVLGLHTPMITEKIYYQVQAIITGRTQVPLSVKKKVYNPLFPLRGIVKCTVCGSSLVSANVRGRSKVYPKYWCGKNCIHSIDSEQLENLLKLKLSKIQPNKDLVNAFTLYLEVKYNQRLNKLKSKKNNVEKNIMEQKQMMLMLVRGHAKGQYPDDIFEEEKERIQNKLLALNIVSNDNLSDQYDIERTVNFIKALFKDLSKAYEVSEYGQKRVLLGSIYPSGLTYTGNELLNHDLGSGFRAVQEFSNSRVPLSAEGGTRTPTSVG